MMAAISMQPDELVLREAATWWLRLRETHVPEESVGQWLTWMDSDECHPRAFDQIGELTEQFATADEATRMRLIAVLAAPAAPFVAPVAPKVEPRARRARWPVYVAAIAASLVVAVFAGRLLDRQARDNVSAGQRYASSVGQNEDISLPDGSSIALGGASALTTRYDNGHRLIELDTGEAFFHVAHDEKRPFVVTAGPLAIRDLGTAFNVRRTDQRVIVAVTEGRVRIAPAGRSTTNDGTVQSALEAVAGQQVSYDPVTAAMTVSNVEPEHAVAWRSNRLEFDNELVSVVVANINRYSRRPVQIADARLGAMTFTGTVKIDSIDSWLDALPQVFPVRVSSFADRIVLSRAERK
ncbi:FecR family protein [Luteibacter rhizovicinus]|uniref:FecR family protein n=1 Tax=Luteibacter rhizovicinus TaxID=242606 RepID=A0A4R3YN96_9GAMM|nr:FecR domain-containing protein [Luteibacter rhizovicinus]TCV94097.1 FecR family protein [Luteibacter rhizovicinus]